MIQSIIQSFHESNLLGRTFLAAGALLTAAMLAAPMPASAQTGSTVTFTNPNCTGYALTGTPPNQTLTCITGSGIPTGCVITGPTSGIWGTPITLTSSCTGGGAATQWAWTGGNCTGVTTQSCSAVETSLPARIYTVTASNASGTGTPVAQTTVTWGASGGAPSGCTVTPAIQTTTFPAILGLTAQCSGGTLPITHSWTGAIVGSWQQTSYGSGIFIQNNYTQATSVTVSTSNSAGIGPTSTASITGTGGGGGGGLTNCTSQGFTNIIPPGGFTATWATQYSIASATHGNFGSGDNTVWLFKLVVPAGTASSSTFGRFTISEYTEAATPRQLTISTLPCDFRPRDVTGVSGPLAACSDSTTCEVYYGVSGSSNFWAGLTAGTTYYVSARNWQSPGQTSCSASHCNALMNVQPALP